MKRVGIITRNIEHKKHREISTKLIPSSELLGVRLYCNFCRRELYGWAEGCFLYYLFCTNCNASYISVDAEYLEEKDTMSLAHRLEDILYEATLGTVGDKSSN